MPRLARLDAAGVLHHVMERGIEQREIFQNDTDRQDFVSWIGVRELGYTGAEVARYLWVTNSCVTRAVSSDSKPEISNLLDNLSTPSTDVP